MFKNSSAKQATDRIWLEIHSDAILHNMHVMQQRIGKARLIPVLKASAYGLGIRHILPIITRCRQAGETSPLIKCIAVTNADEVTEARSLFGGEILLLGAALESEIPSLLAAGATLPIESVAFAAKVQKHAKRIRRQAKIHMLVDTGMGRLGVLYSKALSLFLDLKQYSNLRLTGVYSHLSNAITPEDQHTLSQILRFTKLSRDIQKHLKASHASGGEKSGGGISHHNVFSGKKNLLFHLLNSDGLHHYSMASFDAVRSGINLYGIYEMKKPGRLPLKPALQLKTKIASIRKLPAGFSVGYGREYTLKKSSYVATLTAGYADGLPFALSGKKGHNHDGKKGHDGLGFHVLAAGCRFPILGRISMDYTNIDLGPNLRFIESLALRPGATITLIGKSKQQEISVEDWATLKDSHSYDIVCSLGKRVKSIVC